jgi:hypothetical protein
MPNTATIAVDLYLHVRVLIGILLGLSVVRLVGGVARFVAHPGRQRISFIHLGWVAWALLNVVTFWWWEFSLSRIAWNFGIYFFVCLYASMFFFLSVLLFPDDLREYDGYHDYFMSRRVWFFGFVALTELLDVADTWIKGTEYLRSLGPEYPIRSAEEICDLVEAWRIGESLKKNLANSSGDACPSLHLFDQMLADLGQG